LSDRQLGQHRQDASEFAALKQLASPAAPARQTVFRGADGLSGTASGFYRQKISVAGGRDKPQDTVVLFPDLDENDATAGARQKIHFVHLAQQRSGLTRRNYQDLGSLND
jgi:hypothetical protein